MEPTIFDPRLKFMPRLKFFKIRPLVSLKFGQEVFIQNNIYEKEQCLEQKEIAVINSLPVINLVGNNKMRLKVIFRCQIRFFKSV